MALTRTAPPVSSAATEEQTWAPPQQQQEAPAASPPAVAQPAAVPAAASGNPMAALAEQGFEGLEIGIRSFPLISLQNDGQFTDIDGGKYGTAFLGKVMSSRSKWAYSARHPTNRSVKDEVTFSYDQVTSNGRELEEIFAEKRSRGLQVSPPREYLDVVIQLIEPGAERDGEMRICSISPTSKERFSGFLTTLLFRGRASGKSIQDFVVQFVVGDKVTQGVQQPFYPWKFVEYRG